MVFCMSRAPACRHCERPRARRPARARVLGHGRGHPRDRRRPTARRQDNDLDQRLLPGPVRRRRQRASVRAARPSAGRAAPPRRAGRRSPVVAAVARRCACRAVDPAVSGRPARADDLLRRNAPSPRRAGRTSRALIALPARPRTILLWTRDHALTSIARWGRAGPALQRYLRRDRAASTLARHAIGRPPKPPKVHSTLKHQRLTRRADNAQLLAVRTGDADFVRRPIPPPPAPAAAAAVPRPAIIFLGDAAVPATRPGGPPSACRNTLALLRVLRLVIVILVSEFRTSQVRAITRACCAPGALRDHVPSTVPALSGFVLTWTTCLPVHVLCPPYVLMPPTQDCPQCGNLLGPLPPPCNDVWRLRVCAHCGIIWHRDIASGTRIADRLCGSAPRCMVPPGH